MSGFFVEPGRHGILADEGCANKAAVDKETDQPSNCSSSTFPIQVSDSKFYLICRGFTPYETLKARNGKVLEEQLEG